jgi:RHS repeat-associated protein
VVLPNATVIEYVYDGTQRRVGRRANGALTQAFLLSDSTCPIAELDGTNQVVALFIYGSGSHVPDYFIKGGVSFQIVTDQIGSPRLVINCQTGEIVEEIEFDEFGRVLLDTAPGFQPFGFAGGLRDPDSGLTRFGARDYDAETGRWTTKDPLRFAGGSLNQYSYAMNSPLNLIDSTGLGPPEKNQSQDPSNVGTPNPNATFHPTTKDYKYVLGEIDRIDAELALLSSKCGNVPNGRANSGDENIVLGASNGGDILYNQKLGVDITDPNITKAYELGMGGSTSLLELGDSAYKIHRLQQQKQIYQDFLKAYTPTKRQQAQLPTSSSTWP